MKIMIFGGVVCIVAGVMAAQTAVAQGITTYFSNVEQPSAGSVAVGNDSWLALGFATGSLADSYTLNSIQLAMNDASGSPDDFSVSLYSSISGGFTYPGVSLGALSGSADPSTAGIYTYSAPPDLTLSPNTRYFVLLTAGTPVADGAYELSFADSYSYNSSAGWGVITDDGQVALYLQSSQGNQASAWMFYEQNVQFGVDATPTPEPGVLSLFAAGGLMLALVGRKRFGAA